MIEAAILRKIAGPASIVGLIAAGFTLYSCSINRAEERGAVAQDTKWQSAQSAANTSATAVKKVTEAASNAVSLRVGEKHDQELEDWKRRYAALREQLRRQSGRGAAGRADPGGTGAAASKADEAAGAHAHQLEAEIERLRAHLIDVAEEGDLYRLQVIGLQAYILGQDEADALGQAAATVKDENDARN